MKASTSKLVILDRDGVINFDSDAFIKSPEEWKAIPGSLEAIVRLNKAGFYVAMATNQSGVGRGLFSLHELNAIHQKMTHQLRSLGGHIDYLAFCPHHPDERCSCRKPEPGLFLEILQHFNITLKDHPHIMSIGDAWRDIQAARTIGVESILVLTGKGKKTLLDHTTGLVGHKIYPCLSDAVDFILKESF